MKKTPITAAPKSSKKKTSPRTKTWVQARVDAVSNGYIVTLYPSNGYKTKQIICLTREAIGEVIASHSLAVRSSEDY